MFPRFSRLMPPSASVLALPKTVAQGKKNATSTSKMTNSSEMT